MLPNLGGKERFFRIAAGFLLLMLLALPETPFRWIGLAGVYALATGLIRWCPLYSLVGHNSLPARQERRDADDHATIDRHAA